MMANADTADEGNNLFTKHSNLARAALGHYNASRHEEAKSTLEALRAHVTSETRLADRVAIEHNKAINLFYYEADNDSYDGDHSKTFTMLSRLQKMRNYIVDQRWKNDTSNSDASVGETETDKQSNSSAADSKSTAPPQSSGNLQGSSTDTHSLVIDSGPKAQPQSTPDGPQDSLNFASPATNIPQGSTHVDNSSLELQITRDIGSAEMVTDPQWSTIIYNEAVLYCRLGYFRTSLIRLDVLFKNSDVLDRRLATAVCFLCLDVYFQLYRGLKPDAPQLKHFKKCASAVMASLESCEAQGHTLGEKLPEASLPSSAAHGSRGKAGNEADYDDTDNSEADLARLRFNIRLYSAKLQLILSNTTEARKEIKSALEVYEKEVKPHLSSNDEQTAPALVLKANMEYLRGNFKKCVKLLNVAMSNGSLSKAVHLNNMACLSYRFKKQAASTMYLAQSLALVNKLSNNSNIKERMQRFDTLYNVGLQLLSSGNRLDLALDCFFHSAQKFHARPRLWIHMAECCIQSHHKSLAKQSEDRLTSSSHDATLASETLTNEFQNDFVAAIAGGTRAGGQEWVHPCRRILLPIENEDLLGFSGEDDTSIKKKGPTISLKYAMMCLKNALALTGGLDKFAYAESGESDANENSQENRRREDTSNFVELRHVILLSSSYCALCLNHPLKALEFAQHLLHARKDSKARHRYFAHTYAAEALCLMDESKEALNHAMKAVTEFQKAQGESTQRDSAESHELEHAKFSLKSELENETARSALCVNLAILRLQEGHVELAESSLMKALGLDATSHAALSTLIYLRLRQGKRQEALQLLQERRPR